MAWFFLADRTNMLPEGSKVLEQLQPKPHIFSQKTHLISPLSLIRVES
jgi:hypothetical protein